MKTRALSRRTFLQGMGITGSVVRLALPPLAAMFNSHGTAYAGSGAIPDESDAAKKKSLEGAANTTRAGIAAADMATATKAASEVASELKALK